jgi:hypothetical protein
VSWIVHVRGPVCGAWAGCGQISAPLDQISGPKGPRSRRRDHGPIQISGGCSDRYLVAVVADIWSAEPDIWSEADIWWPSTRYLVPWVHDPAGGMLDPTRYLVQTSQISGHCHVLPRGSASGPTRVAVFNSTSATTAAPSMQRAFPTHGASTKGFSFQLSLAHMGESTPPPAVLPVEAASAQLGFGFRTSSPPDREPIFTRRAVDVYGLKCMTFVCRSSNALGA